MDQLQSLVDGFIVSLPLLCTAIMLTAHARTLRFILPPPSPSPANPLQSQKLAELLTTALLAFAGVCTPDHTYYLIARL